MDWCNEWATDVGLNLKPNAEAFENDSPDQNSFA
jgi:hypothetical protein